MQQKNYSFILNESEISTDKHNIKMRAENKL